MCTQSILFCSRCFATTPLPITNPPPLHSAARKKNKTNKIRILVVPQIQGLRDRAVAEMVEEYAARRLQRIFRGFQGRAHMKRMVFRKNEMEGQASDLLIMRKRLAERRQFRAFCACVVQARFKGIIWRRRLARMQGAALSIQTCYRGYATKAKIKEAQRKMLEGAKVDVVYKRGRVVSGYHLFLTVRRCGLSFKFIGRSEHHMDTFYGKKKKACTIFLIMHESARLFLSLLLPKATTTTTTNPGVTRPVLQPSGYIYRENSLAILEEHNRKCREEKLRLKNEDDRQFADTYSGYDRSKESEETKTVHMVSIVDEQSIIMKALKN